MIGIHYAVVKCTAEGNNPADHISAPDVAVQLRHILTEGPCHGQGEEMGQSGEYVNLITIHKYGFP